VTIKNCDVLLIYETHFKKALFYLGWNEYWFNVFTENFKTARL